MTFEIYLIRNLLNNKIYIGQTSCGHLRRFKEHVRSAKKNTEENMIISRAICKYGAKNFVCELVDGSAKNKEELNELEKKYIKEFGSIVPNGYNVAIGGGVIYLPEEASRMHHNRIRTRNGKYIGVVRRKNTFRAKINYLGRQHNLGSYASEEEAAKAHDIKALEIHGDKVLLNFPELFEDYKQNRVKPITSKEAKPKTIVIPRAPPPVGAPSSYRDHTLSRYRGVTFHNGKWLAQICINRKAKCIGYFRTEEEAARAYDKKRFELFGSKERLNFPQEI